MENIDKTFAQRLRALMYKYDITQKELSTKLKVDVSTVYRYLDETRVPKYDVLLLLTEIFNVSADYLLGITNCKDILQVHEPILEVPVLKGFKAKDNMLDEKNIERYLTIPKDRFEHSQNLFALKINDDVMRPRLYEGDIVIVERNAPLKDGDLGVFCIGDNEACIREFLKTDSHGFVLNRFNPLLPPRFFNLDAIQQKPILTIGKVVEVITFMK